MTGSPDRLERSYRRLLRLYPAVWRQRWEDELLGVLLAQAGDRPRPPAPVAADLLGGAMAARWRAWVAPLSWIFRARVSALSLVGAAAVSLVCLARGELARPTEVLRGDAAVSLGPVLTADAAVYVAWLAALGLWLAGRGRLARRTATAATAGVVALGVAGALTSLSVAPLYLRLFLVGVGLGVVQARPAVLPRTGVALGGGLLTGALFALPGVHLTAGWFFYRDYGGGLQDIARDGWALLLVALAVAAVASRRYPGWFTAVVVAALPWWCLWGLFVKAHSGQPSLRVPALIVAVAVLVALVGAVARRAGQAATH